MKRIVFILLLCSGFWSLSGQNISQGEYFFNVEPGVGNGTALSFTADDSVAFDVTISTAGLAAGFNHLYMRFRLEDGDWGMLNHKTIYILDEVINTDIVDGEYFFNTDPGVGNATAMNVSSGDSVEFDLNISVQGLNAGFNHLYMRFKAQEGGWGMVQHKTLYVLPQPLVDDVVSGEYFIDIEPGVGNGIPFEIVAPADSIVQDFVLQLPELPIGPHTLYIRYVSVDGDWGMLEQRPFTICETYGAQAAFSFNENANTVFFQNESLQADSILWDFGDGSTSILNAPIHTYAEQGSYSVTLLAHNNCGESTLATTIVVEGVENVWPNQVSNNSVSTLQIHGFGFIDGTTTKLTRTGFDDILPFATNVLSGFQLSAIVNFDAQTIGLWNLEVEIPGEGIFVLPNSIEIISTSFSTDDLLMSSVQIAEARTGRRVPATMHIQNDNAADAIAVPVLFRDISDAQQILLSQLPAITDIPFFAGTYQYLLDNGIVNTVMQATTVEETTNSVISGYIIPKVDANSSHNVPIFHRRIIDGTHKHGNIMIFPLLDAASQLGEPIYQNEICIASYVKSAAENALTVSIDEVEWNACFNTWNDSLYKVIAEMALNPDQSSSYLSIPACYCAVITNIAQSGCISNMPAALTADQLNGINRHLLTNLVFFNDGNDIALDCPQLQGLQIDPHHVGQTDENGDRTNEFCEIAQEMGGNSMLSFGGRANQWCALFGSGIDPNMKYGPGDNEEDIFINPGDIVSYNISFENDSNATAPAEIVRIIDSLDADRFELGSFRWGLITLSDSILISPQSEELQQVILTDLRPALPYYLLTNLEFDTSTAVISWNFSTLDTTNLQPLDLMLDGFLPPNADGTEGIGDVSFFIQLSNELVTGDSIQNNAHIVFDFNAPIVTPYWTNVVDNTSPLSEVTELPDVTPETTFMVNWTGEDAPAGISNYTVFVSQNNGPFLPWILTTDTLQSEFTGEIGSVYKFYSIAIDNAGNIESAPEDPQENYDAITQITSGIAEINSEIGLSVYPVPADDNVSMRFTLPTAADVNYDVLDISAKSVLMSKNMGQRIGVVSSTLNVSELSAGIYLLRITIDQKAYVHKLIVN